MATADRAVTDDLEGTALPAERLLRVMLICQIGLGLLWGISMVGFAQQIVLGESSGQHAEKIAMEGAAHLALVFGAILVWRAPRRARDVLLMLIVLNALWVLTDLVYIPVLHLSEIDFYAKTIVNAFLAIGLTWASVRNGLISRESWPFATDR